MTQVENRTSCFITVVKVQGKVHPRTGHEGPDREYWYSSTLSWTLAL